MNQQKSSPYPSIAPDMTLRLFVLGVVFFALCSVVMVGLLMAFRGDVGKLIVFSSNRDGNGEIYVAEVDSPRRYNVTQHAEWDSSPARSPDGSRIAFVSGRYGNLDVFVMDLFGGDVVQVTGGFGRSIDPAWSPDGTQIAFASDHSGDWELYVADADGNNVRRLTQNNEEDLAPTWSPDGTQIMFEAHRDGNWQIYVLDVMPASVVQLIDAPPDFDATHQVSSVLTDRRSRSLKPAWSPDGKWIAFMTDRGGGNFDIWLMHPDGSNLHPITNVDNGVMDGKPSWLPNGRIAFESWRDGDLEVYTMLPDGSDVQRISHSMGSDGDPS